MKKNRKLKIKIRVKPYGGTGLSSVYACRSGGACPGGGTCGK